MRSLFSVFYSFRTSAVLAHGSLLLVGALSACSAVYPGIATPVRAVPPGRVLEPPAPQDVLYIELEGAIVPPRTRDGLAWDSVGGAAPDPYAIVVLDGEQLFRTSTERNAYKPTWADAPKRNYSVSPDSVLTVELWHDNPVNPHPICIKNFRDLQEAAIDDGGVRARCDGGAIINVVLRPAQARFGLGLIYELRSKGVYVKDVLPNSPAARATLGKGQKIVSVMGKQADALPQATLRSLINANAAALELVVSSGGALRTLKLAEGPIYRTTGE